MRPSSLVLVLILAKLCGVAGSGLPASLWVVPVLFWDDVAVGAGLWVIDRSFGRPALTAGLYWVVVAWAVLNVPVVRALGSPLTVNMISAAGGPLFDSFLHYLTLTNVFIAVVLLSAAVWLPGLLTRVPLGLRRGLALTGIALALAGPWASTRMDTQGLERNALTALVRTSLPRVFVGQGNTDWRTSESRERRVDLSSWASTARGRNVVLIVLESTAAQYLRLYGATEDPTPNLTTFALSAIRFERAYTVYPESIKGLFAMLCSRSPAFDVAAEVHAKAACASLVRVLGSRGYRTALFHSGRFAYLGMDAIVRQQGFDTLEDAGAIGGEAESSFGVDDRATVRRMLAWIDEPRAGRPFFVTYLPTAGHHPYASFEPGPFTDPGDRGAYLNALFDGDRAFQTFIEGLETRGLDRETLFVIVGDHGEAFGQHPGNFGHTLAIYDENVRVPLFIVMPGLTSEAVTVPDVASTLDLAPTILDLVGLPLPVEYEGVSLLDKVPRAALFFTDYSIGLLGLQDGCWKYHLDIETPRSRLFDTCADAGETIDRSHAERERVVGYEPRLRAWVGATARTIGK